MNIDIIGKLYDMSDDQEPLLTELEGYHVNTTEPVEAWQQWLVEPTQPRRVFAGVVTYCYRFTDLAHWQELDPRPDEIEE